MRSPFYFVVKPLNGRRYDNIRRFGDISFITSVSQEDHMAANRFAEVISVPLDYHGEIEPGDTLLVHHNTFKIYYDMKGQERSGTSFLKDGLFFVDEDQYFMYKHGGEWKTHSKYCFISPVKTRSSYIKKGGAYEPLIGTVRYLNKELESLGVGVGDEVSFEPDSEYEFEVDGEKLYRMFTKNIVIKWNQHRT